MSASKIFGKPRDEVLADIGTALSLVKSSRGLSPDDMRIVLGLKCDDMVAKYISGIHAMDAVAWLRANEAWPELTERMEESEHERVLRGRQRALDLPVRRERVA